MRIEHSISMVSWIPADPSEGMGDVATRMKMAHHDPPQRDPLGPDVPAAREELRVNDRFWFANQLLAYIDDGDTGTIDHDHIDPARLARLDEGHRRAEARPQ